MEDMMNESSQEEMMLDKDWDKVPGHIAPATIFIAYGTFALIKTLQLTKQLPPGRTFTEVHIPFQDTDTIRRIGLSVMTLTAAGVLYHSLGEGIDTSIRLHMVLYAGFFMVGLIAVLESKQRLMPDSARMALAVSLFLASCVWSAHGYHMHNQVGQNIHVYLGYLNLADAIAFSYSVMRTDSIVAHIMSWALMVLQGIWLYVIALYLCCIELTEQNVEANLCFITILLTIVIAVVIAAADLPQVRDSWSKQSSSNVGSQGGQYEVLTKFHDVQILSRDSDTTEGSSGDSVRSDGNC
jgi:hypothetical protein